MNTRNSNRKLPILWVLENAELASVALSAGSATAAGVRMGAVGAVGFLRFCLVRAVRAADSYFTFSLSHLPHERLGQAFLLPPINGWFAEIIFAVLLVL